jgi:HEAT repeat protein
MKNFTKRSFIVALAIGVFALAAAPVHAAKVKTEDELIADLASPKDSVVADAMLKIERNYPTSTKAVAEIKKYLGDNREKVRRKAARVLGALHAEMSADELKQVCKLLTAADHREVMDGLIALRGLKAADAIPQITPLLSHAQPNVVRDACRTLAVLGNKSHVALIEPLLKNADPKVQKDAQDAIFALNAKN